MKYPITDLPDGGIRIDRHSMLENTWYEGKIKKVKVQFIRRGDVVECHEVTWGLSGHFHFHNEWEDCLKNWAWKFGLEFFLWRCSEDDKYTVYGPEIWIGSVRLFGVVYSRSDVMPDDSRNVSISMLGATFGWWWEGKIDDEDGDDEKT